MGLKKRRIPRYKKRIVPTTHTITREIVLTETDRITYVYTRDNTSDDISEVTNVSYDVLIKKRWITILRYDSAHGYLHQHVLFSLTQRKEFVSKEYILQESTHQDWLTFAIEDIKANFIEYKHAFFERSNLYEVEGE